MRHEDSLKFKVVEFDHFRSEAGWDVEKPDADLNEIAKSSKLIPFDEAFKEV